MKSVPVYLVAAFPKSALFWKVSSSHSGMRAASLERARNVRTVWYWLCFFVASQRVPAAILRCASYEGRSQGRVGSWCVPVGLVQRSNSMLEVDQPSSPSRCDRERPTPAYQALTARL